MKNKTKKSLLTPLIIAAGVFATSSNFIDEIFGRNLTSNEFRENYMLCAAYSDGINPISLEEQIQAAGIDLTRSNINLIKREIEEHKSENVLNLDNWKNYEVTLMPCTKPEYLR